MPQRLLLAWMLLPFVTVVADAASLSGRVEKLNDGDTFEIWGQRIRLKGIDAPEVSQTCNKDNGQSYPCGDLATNHLRSLVQDREVQCVGQEKDEYGRLIAYCSVDGRDINRLMVQAGWAVAYRRFDLRYVDDEEAAQAAQRGIWRGEFVRPSLFRSTAWQQAQRAARQQGEKCLIKGNINADGVRIYHTPWSSKHYARTRINVGRGERWFCTEAEALKAGWRAPYR